MKKPVVCMLQAAFLFFSLTALNGQNSQHTAENQRPIVTGLTAASVSTTRVTISWQLPESADKIITSLLVYRNTEPFASRTQLDSNSLIATLDGTATSYTDTLKNYREYYYAVIALTPEGKRYDIILPSINATVNGVRVERVIPQKTAVPQTASSKEKIYPAGQMRELPLPYLDLITDQNKKPVQFSPKADADAKELAGNHTKKEVTPLKPYIFESDMVSPAGGDDYFLFEIIRTRFIKQKYSDSITAIEKLLSVNRSTSVTDRARFYLGQSFYFSGDYRSALTSFLQDEDSYPSLAKKWIESSLDLYQMPDTLETAN